MHLIVSIGAGLDFGPDAEPHRAGHQSQYRAAAAARLWRRDPTGSALLFSGGRTSSVRGLSEAQAMKDFVVGDARFEVPEDKVLTEDASLDTAQNVRNVVAMIRQLGRTPDRITLISGSRNLHRAAAYFRAHGMRVLPMMPAEVLGAEARELGFMADLERVHPRDRVRDVLLRILQIVDRHGYAASWLVRHIRPRK